MSTRCCIDIIYRGRRYRIYRHSDVFPQGVIADLYVFMNNYDRKPCEDPEYFLANFIFYAKLATGGSTDMVSARRVASMVTSITGTSSRRTTTSG